MSTDEGTLLIAESIEAKFVLLEQFLPDGPSHPFADTMIKHFVKLHSPLKSAVHYPRLEDQQNRYSSNGWPEVKVESLWSIWNNNSNLITPEERQSLDQLEPFDEWEDFILYAAHYFLLIASNEAPQITGAQHKSLQDDSTVLSPSPSILLGTARSDHAATENGRRRLGAGYAASAVQLVHHGGFGPSGRLRSADSIVDPSADARDRFVVPNFHVSLQHEMSCHTITRLASGSHLLVGGRLSPDVAFAHCYLESSGSWKRVDDMPEGRYRHTAVPWGDGALVMGGKTDSVNFANDWLHWEHDKGWSTVNFIGDIPSPRFGACACLLDPAFIQNAATQRSGILTGGVGANGSILADVWQIDLIFESPGGGQLIRCWQPKFKYLGPQGLIFRYGATIASQRDALFLIGGVCMHGCVPQHCEVLRIDKGLHVRNCRLAFSDMNVARPIFIGHQTTTIRGSTLVIYGGGLNCFSFGSTWNGGTFTISTSSETQPVVAWGLAGAKSGLNRRTLPASLIAQTPTDRTHSVPKAESLSVQRTQISSQSEFEKLIAERRPAIIEKLNIGDCVRKWTQDYLVATIGSESEVTVHEANESRMSFLDKNFSYVKKSFGTFMQDVDNGQRQYMRAISRAKPTDKPTTLEDDFPLVASDFRLPPELAFVAVHQHSSPLRISGPVKMWLHYDVSNL